MGEHWIMKIPQLIVPAGSLIMVGLVTFFFSSQYDNIGIIGRVLAIVLIMFFSIMFVVSTNRSFKPKIERDGLFVTMHNGEKLDADSAYLLQDGTSIVFKSKYMEHYIKIDGIKSIKIIYRGKKETLTPGQLIKRMRK